MRSGKGDDQRRNGTEEESGRGDSRCGRDRKRLVGLPFCLVGMSCSLSANPESPLQSREVLQRVESSPSSSSPSKTSRKLRFQREVLRQHLRAGSELLRGNRR